MPTDPKAILDKIDGGRHHFGGCWCGCYCRILFISIPFLGSESSSPSAAAAGSWLLVFEQQREAGSASRGGQQQHRFPRHMMPRLTTSEFIFCPP